MGAKVLDVQVSEAFVRACDAAALESTMQLARAIAAAAERRFAAVHRTATTITANPSPDGDAVTIGYATHVWGHAFTETGNQRWPGSPCLRPAAINALASQPTT